MKKKIRLIIGIIALTVIVMSSTYAYLNLGDRILDDNISFGTATDAGATFTAYSDKNISLNITNDKMLPDDYNTSAIETANANIFVQLEGSTGNDATTCDYDLVWVWDSEDQYKESSVPLPYKHTDNKFYYYEMSVRVGNFEQDLSSLKWNDNKAVITSKSISTSRGEIKKDEYEVYVKIFNLPTSQKSLDNKDFRGHIEVSNVNCFDTPTIDLIANSGELLSDTIKSWYVEDGINDLYFHDGIGDYINADLEAGDNSYRYAGSNPNNYVCFGDDCSNYDNLYRIIGVFDEGVKLIKADYANSDLLGTDGDYSNNTYSSTSIYQSRGGKKESIDRYYWNNINDFQNTNTTSATDWNISRLNNINLNINYLNNIGDKYASMIKPMKWYTEYHSAINYTASNNAKSAYDIEIKNATEKTTSQYKIGLLYITDYYYAALPEYWMKYGGSYNDFTTTEGYYGSQYDYSSGRNDNWLYLGMGEWSISKPNGYGGGVSSSGNIFWYEVYKNSNPIRPVFYLRPDVKYAGGTGTISNPIKLSYNSTRLTDKIKEKYNAGNSGIYYHSSSLANSANDNSYRYSGANPSNYVCFEGDVCNDDNKYRIIGIFGNNVKLIKYTSLGNMQWNSTNNTTVWSGSTIKTYLNDTYLNSLGTNANIITATSWRIVNDTTNGRTAKAYYTNEQAASTSVTNKIGLLYPSEYGYAASTSMWNTALSSYTTTTENWMKRSANMWTILNYTNGRYAFFVNSNGTFTYTSKSQQYAIYPTFSLLATAKYMSGSGTYSDPFIVGS